MQSNELPSVLSDSFLLEKLQELSLVVKDADVELDIKEVEDEVPSIVREIHDDKYAKFTQYIEQLDDTIEGYKGILSRTQTISDQLGDVIDQYNDISEKTNEFIEKTNSLYVNFTEASNLNKAIPLNVRYFDSLDPIMRRLNNATSPNIVRKDSFKALMENVEHSLKFLEEHSDFKQAETYRIKFKQCLIRGCILVATYLNNVMKHTATDVVERQRKLQSNSVDGKDLLIGSREALLYNKFENISEDYRMQFELIIQMLKNPYLKRYSNELNSISNECFDQYFLIRYRLLRSSMLSALQNLNTEIPATSTESRLVEYIQSAKSYFQQLCLDEYKLFAQFFPDESCKVKVNNWFLTLCDPFYEVCNSKIIRETDITVLCDTVSLFNQYYEFEEGSDEYMKQCKYVQFDKIYQPVLQKLQQRLILRVQQYVDKNINKYVSTLETFTLTNRKANKETAPVTSMKGLSTKDDPVLKQYFEEIDRKNMQRLEQEKSGEIEIVKPEFDSLLSYYPPLIKTLAILSKIHDMVNSIVFDDLAHHIVHDCILSLRKAYNSFTSTSVETGANKLDIDLAFLRNLLLLRQQVQQFNIEYTVSETYLDFSAMEKFFSSLKQGGMRRTDSSVFGFARDLVPKVVKNMVDARYELMQELRNIIKNFTEVASIEIVGETLLIPDEDISDRLVEQNVQLRKNVEESLPRIHNQIISFIEDEEITLNLLEAIQEVVVQSYSKFIEQVNGMAVQGVLNRKKTSELMYVDVFSDLFDNVFRKLIFDDK